MPTDTSADTSVEATARGMGWRPLEEFRGSPDKWVDADMFVSRGEHYLPIIRKDRDDLRNTTASLKASLDETKRLLAASQEAIAELKSFHDQDTQRQVEKARKDLVAQLKSARESGDVDSEVAAQSEITKLDVALASKPAAAAAPVPSPSAAETPPIDPAFQEWLGDNEWFNTDARKRALALAIGNDVKAADPSLVGRKFYDRVSEEVEAYLAPAARGSSKVAGGRPTTSRSAGGAAGRTYADLPADAKQACESFSRKLVGPGRAFKDMASWQADYTAKYFAGESE